MRAAIVGRDNFAIERDLLRLPAHAEARFTKSVLLSRTAASCAFLPRIETVVYFRTAGFFRGADFSRGAAFGGLSASLTALPAWNRTALLAAILMVSPLCGFRPSRAGRAATSKVPRPETRTASPATRESRMAFTTAFTA
jgi:putative acetyltransferase